MAEAAVFRVLQQCGAEPEVADMVNKGGPDFHCVPRTPGQFMVEATSFLPRKITDDTALQNEAPDEVIVHAFSLLTRQIDEKATQKKRQFDALPMPGILAIASNHFGAGMVLNSTAATNALISQPFWVHGKDAMSTDLGSSLFLRLEQDGEIVAKNTSISAVILISVLYDRSYVCGAINPAAAHPLDTRPLWQDSFRVPERLAYREP